MDIPSNAIIMLTDPADGMTLEQAKQQAAAAASEREVADIFALVYNKARWVEDETYDYKKGTPEYSKARRTAEEWFSVEKELRERIFAILRGEGTVIPEKGYLTVLIPFMERNGYRDGCGWWIRKSEWSSDMAEKSVLGLRTKEDDEFLRFFAVVQSAAEKLGCVYFVCNGEANERKIGDYMAEDLFGWLIPKEKVSEFEKEYYVQDLLLWDGWSDYMCFEETEDDEPLNGLPKIVFKSY